MAVDEQETGAAASTEPPQQVPSNDHHHAHLHVTPLLALPTSNNECCKDLQYVERGSSLTSEALLKEKGNSINLHKPILITDTPSSIGMKLPPAENFTVRDVAKILGYSYPVRVIDVKHQEEEAELEGWTLGDLVDYFEDEQRLLALGRAREKQQQQSSHDLQQQQEEEGIGSNTPSSIRRSGRSRRRSSRVMANEDGDQNENSSSYSQQQKRVINQISLEFSRTPLVEQVRSPQFVRDIDWIDNAWSRKWRYGKKEGIYPAVQYYCLTSAAGCYTDFHLDFGGTSVWYTVLHGEKIFCLIPPTPANLQTYEEWICRSDQAVVFLPNILKNKDDAIKVSLKPGQTFIIPSGWIHAVYTPSDSLVFGGNFLHGLSMRLQLECNSIETRSRVNQRYRFPHFIPLQFYAGGMYLRKLRDGCVCQREVDELPFLLKALDEWWKVHASQEHSEVGLVYDKHGPSIVMAAREAAQMCGCENVNTFLRMLRTEHARVVRDGIVPNREWRMKCSPTVARSNINVKNRNTEEKAVGGPKRIKLRIVPDPKPKKEEEEEDNGSRLRIRLSHNSSKSTSPPSDAIPTSARQFSSGNRNDEEWMPSPSQMKKMSQQCGVRGRQSPGSPGGRAMPPKSPRSSKKQKMTSVRQRLLKKTG